MCFIKTLDSVTAIQELCEVFSKTNEQISYDQ